MELNYKMLAGETSVTLEILDYIGDGGFTLKDLLEQLGSHTNKDITVLINSAGGSVMEGLSIYNFLRSNFTNVTTEVIGYAASISSIIFLAGNKRIMREGTMLFLHNPWMMVSGNSTDLRTEAETLDKIASELTQIYVSNSALLPLEVKKLMDEETWIGSVDALDYGFATEIDGQKQRAVAHMPEDFISKVKNIPNSFKLIEKEEQETVHVVNEDFVQNKEPELNPISQEAQEEKNTMTNVVPQDSAPESIVNVQNLVKSVSDIPKFEKFRDYFNALGNTNFTPKEIQQVLDVVAEQNPLRKYASVYNIAGDGVVPVPGLATASYGADGATLTPADPTITPVTLSGWNLQGVFAVTDALMNDDFYNVAKMISGVIGGTLGDGETAAMLGTGDGSAGPQGIFSKTADVTTGGSGALTAAEFLDFEAGLETKYRNGNEVMIMHPTTLSKIAGLADTSKKIDLDRTAKMINGVPYVTSSKCPAFAAGASVIAFGDFKRGYAIANRGYGVQVKRVPSATAFAENVLFGVKNDGKIVDSTAFHVLKIKA